MSMIMLNNRENITAWLDNMRIQNYHILDDLSVNVDGSVYLIAKELIEIPVQFNHVTEDFYCNDNKLTSLKGCPKIVGGSFYCNDNELTSLLYLPEKIGHDFYCNYNKLTSLKGCHSIINGGLCCSDNQLTNLEYGPKVIQTFYDCSNNQLISLKGCPDIIGGDFICYNNKLTSLLDSPVRIEGNFNVSHNLLISLKSNIIFIRDNFYCSDNKLNSLNYFPKYVGESYFFVNNPLDSWNDDWIKDCFIGDELRSSFIFLENISHLFLIHNDKLFDDDLFYSIKFSDIKHYWKTKEFYQHINHIIDENEQEYHQPKL